MIALVVHGGAWDIPDELVDAHRHGVQQSLKAGWGILGKGGSAVDAVEAAIRWMEDDETFDAGRGSFINAAGEVELDASIMNGKSFRAGAVAAVQNIKNPISLARSVMEESDIVFLVGIGATRFAREHGIPTCRPDDLITNRELERWREEQRRGWQPTKEAYRRKRMPVGTVGAIAIDRGGTLVSGTSTGGAPNKYPGRVGDSPIIGAGTYADNAIGAVSVTGWGEAMMKVVMAKTVIDLMERYNGDAEKAAREGVKILSRKVEGFGGVIALTRRGDIGISFNTRRMARGYMSSDMKAPFVEV